MRATFDVPPPMTLDEFLERERRHEIRHEWDGVRAIAVGGGPPCAQGHAEIAGRLRVALATAPRGTPFAVIHAGMSLGTARGARLRHPDVVVTGSPPRRTDRDVPDPVLIAEIEPEEAIGADRGIERAEHAELPIPSALRRPVRRGTAGHGVRPGIRLRRRPRPRHPRLPGIPPLRPARRPPRRPLTGWTTRPPRANPGGP